MHLVTAVNIRYVNKDEGVMLIANFLLLNQAYGEKILLSISKNSLKIIILEKKSEVL